VTGVALAFTSVTLAKYFENPLFDSIGSISIGILLGAVASFLVKRNVASLVETSMPMNRLSVVKNVLEKDPVVR